MTSRVLMADDQRGHSMTPTERLLLDLFRQVSASPDAVPDVPVEQFPEDSGEGQLLEAFQDMLARLGERSRRLGQRYEQLVNSIDGIVWEAVADTVEFTFVSQQAERLLGYPTSDWLENPSFWQEHMHPEDRGWAVPFCALATAERRPHEFEYRMIAADGRHVWLRDIVTIAVEEGEPDRLRGVMVDITEQKRAQEALERLQRQHELILNAAAEGIFGIDHEGCITFANPAAARMLGWEPAELIGRPGHATLHHSKPDGSPYPEDECPIYASTLRDGTVRAVDDEVFWRKDGTSIPVEYVSTPLRERGEIVGAVMTVRDVSRRRTAEERLREKEDQYRTIFEATTDGLIINDLEGYVVEASPAACHMHGYTREEFVGLHSDAFHPPEHRHVFGEYLAMTAQGRDFRTQGLHLHQRRDGTTFPVEVHGTTFTYKGRPHSLGVVRDVTERVQAYQLLERRVEERTRQLATLLELSRNVASTLELKPLLELILDQLRGVVAYDSANIAILAGDELGAVAYRGPVREEVVLGMSYPAERLGDIWVRLQAGECVVLNDIHGDTHLDRALQNFAGDSLRAYFRDTSSALLAPLVAHERVIGFLGLGRRQSNSYNDDHARLVLAIANQAAIAIDNARLYQAAQEEARKTAALARVASSLALGSALEVALDEVARNVVKASGAVASTMMIAEGDGTQVQIFGAHGMPEGYAAGLEAIVRAGHPIMTVEHFDEPGALVVRDLRQFILSKPSHAPIHPFMRQVSWDTMVSLPLVYHERHLGRLNLYYLPDREPGKDELEFLAAVASQAATAVENARLYGQAQALAAVEERQRLARELHDSVSQALYGIALGTRTARTLLERNQPGLPDVLEYITSLAAAGMAEMRALIFELRPESLESEGLVAALGKQAASIQARHRIEVVAELPAEPELPLETKEVLYRIAQEAMHNTVKHAQARQIHLSLAQLADGILLEVRDDGVGFDPNGAFPGHLGLKSMRERVARLGGSFAIESAPGKGTTVRARVPVRGNGS